MQDALISLSGNVGTDVEFSQGEGWQLARFRLACTPRRLRQALWVDGETTWVSVNCWGRMAENVIASLAKGDPVVVTGKLRTSAWTTPDGVRHERLLVEAGGIGHDLGRGTSSFTRNERRAERTITDEQGNQIDTTTGEVTTAPGEKAQAPSGEDPARPVDPAAPPVELEAVPVELEAPREEVLATS